MVAIEIGANNLIAYICEDELSLIGRNKVRLHVMWQDSKAEIEVQFSAVFTWSTTQD